MASYDRRDDFPADFLWGVATASYQVEGAVDEDGRKPSIWDTYCRTPGKIAHGHTGDVAADQYHRYREDVELMGQLGVGAYRFSMAWPRIIPDGRGAVNERGLDYYKHLIGALREASIEPVVTLYHWDLPQSLEDGGGWRNRETAYAFAEYAAACFDHFPEVTRWITLNEPYCSSVLGYYIGRHAPGLRDHDAAMGALHHLLLGHGLAVERFRGRDGEIGITLNMTTPRPATANPRDVHAADRAADLTTRMFLDPLFGRGYCDRYLETYNLTMPVQSGDLDIVASPIDFLGINYYWEDAVRHDSDHPEGFGVAPTYHERTTREWPVTPEGLIRHLRRVRETTGDLPLYITENGMSLDDTLTDGATACNDRRRIDYLATHLAVCRRAIDEGIPLKGYFLWSFIDNFEWSFGYEKRFGIVYCDFTDGRRVPKDSFYYYRDVIAGTEPVGNPG